MNIRKRMWVIVEAAKPGDTASRTFDIAILAPIFLNVVAVILLLAPVAHDASTYFLWLISYYCG